MAPTVPSTMTITMVDTDNMLKSFGEKLNAVIEGFKENTVWLKEIQEEAERMFISDFSAEPELMPKTPSERKQSRRRPSVALHRSKRFSKSRKNLRHSSIQRRMLENKRFEENDGGCNKIVEQAMPMTRSAARAAIAANQENEQNSKTVVVPNNGRMPLIDLSSNDCKTMELHEKGQVVNLIQTPLPFEDVKLCQKACTIKFDLSHEAGVEILSPAGTVEIVRRPSRAATKLKLAEPVNLQENGMERASALTVQELNDVPEVSTNVENCIPENESKALRRSVRKRSRSKSISLVDKYSLNVQQSDLKKKSMKKSLSKSSTRKKIVLESSSCENGNDFGGVGEKESEIKKSSTEDTTSIIKVVSNHLSDLEEPKEEKSPDMLIPENRECRQTLNVTKVDIVNLENEVEPTQPQPSRTQKNGSSDCGKSNFSDGQSVGRKRSYKCAVANEDSYSEELEKVNSPPRKKTPSPDFATNKVVRPKHKTFLHTVQKNQLLMTPVSVSRYMVKTFIKRNTPLKVDLKEQEKIRLENLKKKKELEEERIQKVEEQKKRKVEEFKKKREMQVKRVMETRSRVQQQEEEKKKKIEEKFAQIDGKNAKVREERFAEEKAKRKAAAKRMEEAEARRRQEEEARKQKLQQLEEERQELLQRKKEEELERQRKIVEARKLQEQRQAELEREKQREWQLAADREKERKKEQENIQAEKERARLEKEKALQLQRELERTAREDAALHAEREKAEKEKLYKEARKKTKLEEQQLAELERQHLEKEIRKEQEIKEQEKRDRENEERKWKEGQDKEAEVEIASKNTLNVTVEVHHTPPPQSYSMTPNVKVKLPKVNLEDYGMDLNSDDSTDDEGAPRKPIPAWASGNELKKALMKQYYHPIDLDKFFGTIQPPNLETIFKKSKPRYLKRTSSAVWHSPPLNRFNAPYEFKKY
ncbi:inner centromere protein A isoform X2 [Narcine bancroftii]|uniref:inner centromere protein A isoform X2 n=1 Tax=Narcine bancroftii TaxID=1343680 RepID=UPI0038318299